MKLTGRTLAMTLVAWGCGLTTVSWAQGYAPGGDVVTLPVEAGGFSYSSGAFGDDGGMSPMGYGAPANCPPGQAPGAYCPPAPEPACWWKCRPLCISPRLLKPPRGAYVRLEYLLWEIEEPGNVLLGGAFPNEAFENPDRDFDIGYFSDALTDNDFDPTNGYFRFDPETFLFEFAYAPRMNEFGLRDNSGIRGTIGIPTYDYGTIELSGWALNQASDQYLFTARELIPPQGVLIPGVAFDPATIFTVDGETTGMSMAYNEGLQVDYRSEIWGADAEFVVDALAPQGEGLKFKPLFGFKYVGFRESMLQRGRFQPLFGQAIHSTINSHTHNTLLGGTVGLRTELEHRWFTVGVQPSVSFAGNIAKAETTSERLVDNSDPRRDVESDYFDFCPTLDLAAYARVCICEGVNLTVGYDAFWMSNVYRAARVVDYDLTTENGTLQSNVKTKRVTDDVHVEGLSVGLEFIF